MEYYYEVSLLKAPLEPLTYKYNKKIEIGTLVAVPLQRRAKLQMGVVVKEVEKPSFRCIDIKEITNRYYSKDMLDIAKFISNYYISTLGEALNVYIPFEKDIARDENITNIKSDIVLSTSQQKAFDFIDKNRVSLLFADTGSGKTEIYIKMIEKIISQGREALLLIPEISLSPQMEQRLKKVFGDIIAVWHSKISKKKKDEITQGLLKGDIKIIAGARSSLFLPYNDLGLIIVDEEHDDSYKSEQKPRLNIKDLSIYIGSKYDIKVILGSATPSLSSFYKIPYIRVTQTFFKSEKEIIYDVSDLSLNKLIVNEIKDTLKKKQQVIIFLPTRANFKYQICQECGEAVECPFCSVSMSLHKSTNGLHCHYCNYSQAIPKKCPSCKTGDIKNYRLGTAEVESQLKDIFPTRRIELFDRDKIKTDTQLKKVLKEFNNQKIDILVGTQMLSKGHDYHNVTLAVVLGIDSVLRMNSYKVREKALSLLIQISGRSGRKGFGKVLIQTKNPDFFNQYTHIESYKEFLDSELSQRKDIYPPFVRMARVVFSHNNSQIAQKEMYQYILFLKKHKKEIDVIGFGECSISKIANKYRYELLIKSKNVSKLLTVLHSIKTANATIDMDTLY
ncbi:MAG: primosomal protein N' [Campylobacterota bacterium]|nr:primosomal protein N' [Campylobacterota bacterium]